MLNFNKCMTAASSHDHWWYLKPFNESSLQTRYSAKCSTCNVSCNPHDMSPHFQMRGLELGELKRIFPETDEAELQASYLTRSLRAEGAGRWRVAGVGRSQATVRSTSIKRFWWLPRVLTKKGSPLPSPQWVVTVFIMLNVHFGIYNYVRCFFSLRRSLSLWASVPQTQIWCSKEVRLVLISVPHCILARLI